MENLETLEKKAIDAAINSSWKDAITLNKKILKKNKKNLAALLRLAFAYFQTKKIKNAYSCYKKIVKLYPNNPVAKKNLEKIKVLLTKNSKNKKNNNRINLNPDIFLEIPGKTKTVKLVNLGQKNIIANLSIGEEVTLKIKRRKVDVRNKDNEYIGSLPDDLSRRLRLFLKAGSQYQVFVKEASINQVIVFIKEIKKGAKVANYISFPENLSKNIVNIGDKIDNSEDEEDLDSEETNIEEETDLEKIAETIIEEKDSLNIDENLEEDNVEEE